LFGYASSREFLASVENIANLYAQPGERPVILDEIDEKGFIKDKEVRFIRKDGQRFWGKLDTTFHKEGNRIIYEGVLEDISERKAMEDLMQKNAERLEILIHALPVGIVIIDPATHKIVDVNPKAVLMIGAPADRIIGSPCHNFICSAQAGQCPVKNFGHTVHNVADTFLTADGENLAVHKTVLPLQVDEKDLLLECFIDISEHKRAERERLKKEKLKGVVEMAGAVCHELNQPLQSISGFSELLMMEMEKDMPAYEKVSIIKNQVGRMGEITKKLMHITKYETKGYLEDRIIDLV